jgi:hypothetical protein
MIEAQFGFLVLSQMDGDHAVVLLARRSTPLTLDTRRFLAFLRTSRFVNNADAMGAGMLGRHHLLQPGFHQTMIPIEQTQKLLQRSRRNAGGISNRFAVLPWQIGQMTFYVEWQMLARVTSRKTTIEPSQNVRNFGRNEQICLASMPAPPGSLEPTVSLIRAGITKTS